MNERMKLVNDVIISTKDNKLCENRSLTIAKFWMIILKFFRDLMKES